MLVFGHVFTRIGCVLGFQNGFVSVNGRWVLPPNPALALAEYPSPLLGLGVSRSGNWPTNNVFSLAVQRTKENQQKVQLLEGLGCKCSPCGEPGWGNVLQLANLYRVQKAKVKSRQWRLQRSARVQPTEETRSTEVWPRKVTVGNGSRVTSVKVQLELREHRAGTECSRKLKQFSNTNLGLGDRLLQVVFSLLVCAEAGSRSHSENFWDLSRVPVNNLMSRPVRTAVGPFRGPRVLT